MAKKESKKWFERGKAGEERLEREQEERKKQREKQGESFRWRLKNKEEGYATFLDTPEFFFREHQVKTGPKRYAPFTCLADFETCPLDRLGNPANCVATTVIDHRESEYTDKKEVVHKQKNVKRLFVAKGSALENLLRQVKNQKMDLRLCTFLISRGSNEKSAATGETFEFKKRLKETDLRKLAPAGVDTKEYLEPLNYEELLAPKPAKELRELVGAEAPIGSADEEEKMDQRSKKSKEPEAEHDETNDIQDLL